MASIVIKNWVECTDLDQFINKVLSTNENPSLEVKGSVEDRLKQIAQNTFGKNAEDTVTHVYTYLNAHQAEFNTRDIDSLDGLRSRINILRMIAKKLGPINSYQKTIELINNLQKMLQTAPPASKLQDIQPVAFHLNPNELDEDVEKERKTKINQEKLKTIPPDLANKEEVKRAHPGKQINIGSFESKSGNPIKNLQILLPGDICLHYSKGTKQYQYVQIIYVDEKEPPHVAYMDGRARIIAADIDNFYLPNEEISRNPREHSSGFLLGTYGVPQREKQIKNSHEFQIGEVYLYKVAHEDNKYVYVEIKKVETEPDRITFSDSGLIQSVSSSIHKFFHTRIVDPSIELEVDSEKISMAGIRTGRMIEALETFSNYDPESRILEVAGKAYTPLSSDVRDISLHPIASCGSSVTREVILLDPQNSPLLNQKYYFLKNELEQLRKINGGNLSEEVVLKHVMTFVRESVFNPKHVNLEQQVESIINSARSDSHMANIEVPTGRMTSKKVKVPFIPIDFFINKGLGVCRHHALILSYFLDKLTKEPQGAPFLKGVILQMRSDVNGGAHAWATYISQNQRFHIDSLWNVFQEFSDKQSQTHLNNIGYGFAAIELQVQRTRKLRKELPQ